MNRERQQQFLEYLADQYKFYRDRREVFFARFDPANADKPHNQLHLSFEDGLNKRQKIQDELQNIGERLKQDGCEIVSKKGRAKKGGSPWEQAYNWLWTVKFPEWEKDHEPPEEGINWKDLCNRAFWEEKTRRKRATEKGHEVQVYVPLGLVKRQQQPRRTGEEMPGAEAGMQQYQLTEKEIEERYEYENFLAKVIGNAEKNLAIIGEPGAGKTTWLDQIGQDLINTERYPIWIPLARLQGMTLEAFLLEKWLKENLQVLQPTPEQKDEFIEWFKTEKVWVLLDGADEMSAANPVVEIRESLTGWVQQARVVLSCRLNVWESNLTTLEGFETYRTLCFEREQVEQFITDWFKWEKEPELGKQLAQRLQEAESARILDLVRNPLRLSLLCKSWVLNPGILPVTKANLYEQFCRDFYIWKQDKFPTTFVQRQQLNQRLAELALRGIRENVLFRETLVYEVLEEEEWVKLAKDVGWLNFVYLDNYTEEPVYAFLHLTFQEYFAACAVPIWHCFLPSDHSPEQPSSQPYRIFESRWREVILLWLGRRDVEHEQKEEFIEALVSFEHGIEERFYEDRTYLLAADGLGQLENTENTKLSDAIIRQIIVSAFHDFEIGQGGWQPSIYPIELIYEKTFLATNKDRLIEELSTFITSSEYSAYARSNAAKFLGKIDPGNQIAILTLIEIMQTPEYDGIFEYAAYNLAEIGFENTDAIDFFISIIQSFRNFYVQDEERVWRAVEMLGWIGHGNCKAIKILLSILKVGKRKYRISFSQASETLKLIAQNNYYAISRLQHILTHDRECDRHVIAKTLGLIDPQNKLAIAEMTELLEMTENPDERRVIAEDLGEIDPGNAKAICALLSLIRSPRSSVQIFFVSDAVSSLVEIANGNQQVIEELCNILENNNDEFIRASIVKHLWKIDPDHFQSLAVCELVDILKKTDHSLLLLNLPRDLEKIAKGNADAIAVLIEMMVTTDSENIRRGAIHSLGQIAQGHSDAVTTLSNILDCNQDDQTLWQAADSLKMIDPGNSKAIVTLLKLLITSKHQHTPKNAAQSLSNTTLSNTQERGIVSTLQRQINNETYENNSDLFNNCYELLWNIAQDLPYPDFYRAWHHLDTAPHPEVADQTPVGKTALTDTLNAQLLDLPNQLHPTPHTTPVCVDIEHLTDYTNKNELAEALSNPIFEQLFPGEIVPEITNRAKLQRQLMNAKQRLPRPHIALILHNGDPQECLLHLCQFLAPTVSIAGITHTPLDAPLRGFPPDRENLVSALQSWLESLV
ncbi:MAG: HEAT repeat domain-containing protein [Roseofilum sp. SBFL]|uniref:HEAT repeat domain-containing protein n=1 Tax=unclassified Roseofilum TaxID=2620099 RepID=UPI001B26E982|nr:MULTISPECIES: HEAT repeat domain-containing protein [unclassified Roseofilum]MBP0011626.1 HEAT repeat domain-containing protein [Roseofilum sp. SID3]MBP0026638.1 HEAT repeat domain-containing protein [Roseofilum sp. SID2]MBP0040069.1 HEAT repeat domain-containing protein [Roseofilum sp. SID1]MBP0044008.1 HEAT repeat domain-containing protein [Roseofilum sp. SBFL]